MAINPFELLGNAQKLQEQMGNFQSKLGDITVTGAAGGGMVEIEFNGRMEVLAVHIENEAMEDRAMLEDLVSAAISNALEKVKEAVNQEVGSLASGLGIPGLGAGGFPGFPGSGFPGGGFPGFGTGSS
jgi:DNA-binding YbaB/EbfC family protein